MISVESLVRDPDAGAAEQDRPAQATEREAGIEHQEGQRHEADVRFGDEARDPAELLRR